MESKSEKPHINVDINVTSPLLPDLNKFEECLKDIWDEKYITNGGKYLRLFEGRLREYLGVPYICVVNNGTSALMIALAALNLSGEVITTPYTFVATAAAIVWAGLKPVFVDTDENCNINPGSIEAAITENTSAILGVHTYGNPCQTEKIRQIAERHHLKVVYDAAHAFGVEINGSGILNFGDASAISFHATKVFNTIEGGAVATTSKETYDKLCQLRNFGYPDLLNACVVGINCKMNELQAAYGVLNLLNIDEAIAGRKIVANIYAQAVDSIDGICIINLPANIRANYAYFPIFVQDGARFTRDQLFNYLDMNGIHPRKYFYPLVSNMKAYREFKCHDLKNAAIQSNSVLCLPLHSDITADDATRILEIL